MKSKPEIVGKKVSFKFEPRRGYVYITTESKYHLIKLYDLCVFLDKLVSFKL